MQAFTALSGETKLFIEEKESVEGLLLIFCLLKSPKN